MSRESPLAEAVAQSLREEIESGKLAVGRPLPAERDLAEKFGVSRTLVRKAVGLLAGTGYLRVQPHCRPVIAIPSGGPDDPSGTKVDHVSVWLWPYADDFAASSIFKGIQKTMSGSGLRLMIAIASAAHGQWNEVLDSESNFIRETANDPTCAGAVMWLLGGARSVPALKTAKEHSVPVVFIDRRPPAMYEADFVGSENTGSARRVVRHLAELGHRRIACVTNMDEVSTVEDRFEGYRRALEDAGLPFDEQLVRRYEIQPGEPDTVAMDRLVTSLTTLESPPTAIFVVNDTIAFLLVDRLQKAGMSVPQDLSVAGFDGLLRWVPGGGRLTTANQDFYRMGELAAELLLERIRYGEPKTYRHVLLDAPLAIQASTAPPKQDPDRGPRADSPVEFIHES